LSSLAATKCTGTYRQCWRYLDNVRVSKPAFFAEPLQASVKHALAASAGLIASAILSLLTAQPASAGHNVFHIFTPAVEAEHWGVEFLNGFNLGLPREGEHGDHEDDSHEASAGDGHGRVRAAHEIALHAGVTDFWMTKLALGLEKEAGGDYAATTIASENVFRFGPARPDMVDFAWFTSISASIEGDSPHAFAFGPIISLDRGPVTLVLNPFFEKTFGRNREDGIAFSYGWRATYELSERLHVGLEGYGEIDNIGNAPPGTEQVHRVGPVLYIGHLHGAAKHAPRNHETHASANERDHEAHPRLTQGDIGGSRDMEWHAEIGILFGITEATPDAALKLNIGADF
jgi:hypothetical protein